MGRKRRLGEGKEREGSGGRGMYPLPPSPGYATGYTSTLKPKCSTYTLIYLLRSLYTNTLHVNVMYVCPSCSSPAFSASPVHYCDWAQSNSDKDLQKEAVVAKSPMYSEARLRYSHATWRNIF